MEPEINLPVTNISKTTTAYNQAIHGQTQVSFIDVLMLIGSFPITAFMISSVVVFNRTKRTPKVGRFLASSLIMFHSVRLVLVISRTFAGYADKQFYFQVFTYPLGYLTYVTVAIMSVERAVFVKWPNFYLRRITLPFAVKVSVTIWITIFSLSLSLSYFTCNLHPSYDNGSTFTSCYSKTTSKFVLGTLSVILLTCFTGFYIVFSEIRRHARRIPAGPRAVNSLYNTRSLVLLVIHFITFVISTVVFICVSVTISSLNDRFIFILSDLTFTVRGVIDTACCVFCFAECRMELMKMFICLFPSLERRVEIMKIKVFDIPTYTSPPNREIKDFQVEEL